MDGAGVFMTTTDWPKPGMQSSDVDLLQGILKIWCAENAVDLKSDQARAAARSLVDWYEFGIKDPVELKSLIDG